MVSHKSQHLSQYKNGLINGNTHWNIDEIIPYFSECDALDKQSLNKLDMNGKYLAKMELNELSEIFTEYIRSDVMDVINERWVYRKSVIAQLELISNI